MSSSAFKVNYKTGEVEKIGSSTQKLNGYKKDKDGTATSNEIDIY
jgi:hypothetical protein